MTPHFNIAGLERVLQPTPIDCPSFLNLTCNVLLGASVSNEVCIQPDTSGEAALSEVWGEEEV
jgi:hypothetical protein